MADANDATGHTEHVVAAATHIAPVIRRTYWPMGLAWTATRPKANALNADRGAVGIDPEIGLLLPCTVVVRADGRTTLVQALDPQVMVSVTGRPELKPVADDAAVRLHAALDSLTAESR